MPTIYNVPLKFRQSQLSPIGDIYRLTLHHTVTASPLRKAEVIKLIEQVHQWHLDKGWAGEGYHYIIDRLGRIYKARPTKYSGAHTANENYGNIGVAVLGDFSTSKLNYRQRAALRYLVEKYKREEKITLLAGHKEWPGQATACPGTILSYVRWMREKYHLRRP